MAWDFETDPDYAAQLEWADGFVREHLWPIETLFLSGELEMRWTASSARSSRSRTRSARAASWATHLPAELGWPGHGQVKLGLLHEIPRVLVIAPLAFGNYGAGLGQLRDPRDGRDARAEGALARAALLAGDIRSAFSMTEPHTAGSDPTLLQTQAVKGRARVRHLSGRQVVLVQRDHRRLPDRHGRHRPDASRTSAPR